MSSFYWFESCGSQKLSDLFIVRLLACASLLAQWPFNAHILTLLSIIQGSLPHSAAIDHLLLIDVGPQWPHQRFLCHWSLEVDANGYFRAKLFPVCNFQRGLVCCKDWYSSWGDSLALLNYTCLELRIDPVCSLSGKLTFSKIMKVGWNIFLKPKTQLCSLKIFSLCMKIFMGCFRGFRI